MLILQGGRDYQVTEADDLALWRAGLGDRGPTWRSASTPPTTTCSSPGAGPSTPAEYSVPANIDPAVIEDIVRWLDPQTPRGKRMFSGMRGGRS